MIMKMAEVKQDTKTTLTSESLGAVERERERERAYSSKIEGLENSSFICAYKNFEYAKNRIRERGVTLIALVVTILFPYDEKLKCSNSKGFLLTTI